MPIRKSALVGLGLFVLVSACSGSGDIPDDPGPRVSAGITSDDFSTGVLDSAIWSVVDPQGDGSVSLVGAGTPDAHLLLSVPPATEHDAWIDNATVRVMQDIVDGDFEVEVKFVSTPTVSSQSQGLLVQQDGANYLRYDVHRDDSSLRAHSATFSNSSTSIRASEPIDEAPEIYLRLRRVGDEWTARYSGDGSSWTTIATFTHELAASSVGVFAGNSAPSPAHTAVVDYFFETSTPIVPEDPPRCDPTASLILTTTAIDGTILREPDQSSYSCGDAVTLTARPDVGATFVGWGGALSGTENPVTVTLNADAVVTASFDVDVTAPRVTRVDVTPSETSADVVVETDELSIVSVEYGETTAYERGGVDSTTLSTSHTVTLPGLLEGTRYHYRITTEDRFGNRATGADATFVTLGGLGTGGTGGTGGLGTGGAGGSNHSGAFVSDDFRDGVLDPVLWDVVDPLGDGTVELLGAGSPDAYLLMTLPAGGNSHDAWTTNTALRVMQPAADEDFEIEVKFESEPTQRYQDQGLLVEQDPSNYLRFDVFSDGEALYVFSATIAEGSPAVQLREAISSAPTIYLRLRRNGDQWTARYSFDGASWVTAKSFSHALSVSSVGVYAGNAMLNPAFTAVVDYFFELGSPIEPEDPLGCAEGQQFTVAVNWSGPGTVALDPSVGRYDCGDEVTLTAEPEPDALFVGWGGALRGTSNPASLTVAADTSVTADFVLDTFPPEVSNVTSTATTNSATIRWTTDEVTTGVVEYGVTTSYELGAVASSSASTAHDVTLNDLAPEQSYYYRVSAEDAIPNAVMTRGYTFLTASSSGGPAVDVWYGPSQTFGALGQPQTWVNVLGQVYDPDGLSILTYSLNGAPEQNLSVGPYRRIAEPGDFNVEIDYTEMLPGTNTIEIRAVDGLGFETIKTITVDYAAGTTWPLPYSVDWSSAAEISDVAQVVDGRWSIVGGALRNDLLRYDRAVAIGDIAWTDYEVTVPITINGISSEASGGVNGYPAVGVMLKWPGHSDWDGDQPTWGYYPSGGGGWYEFRNLGPGQLSLRDFEGNFNDGDPLVRVLALGTTYVWKVRVETQTDGSSLYRMKVWPEGSPEPSAWELSDTDTADVPGGSLLLIAHFAHVSFGDVIVEPL